MNALISAEPNSLLLKRLVDITSYESIRDLEYQDVVRVLMEPVRPKQSPNFRTVLGVHDGKIAFYSPIGVERPGAIIQWTTPLSSLHPHEGLALRAENGSYDTRKVILPNDFGYEFFRADLTALGLM